MIHVMKHPWDIKYGLNLEPGKKYTRAIHLMIPTPFKTIGDDPHFRKLSLQRLCLIFSVVIHRETIEVLEEEFLMQKVIQIGDWDMDAEETMTLLHGLNRRKVMVQDVHVTIVNDNDDVYYSSKKHDDFKVISIDETLVTLVRQTGGRFDSSDFNRTNFNRGHVTIEYTERMLK